MMPLAFILPENLVLPLSRFSDLLFEGFVVVSFLCVALYVLRQAREGQLINHARSPLPIKVPGLAGWLFIVCVVELIFLQSAFYLLLVLVGILGVLVESGRSANEQFGFLRLPLMRLLSASLLVFGAVMLLEMPLTQGIFWLMDRVHLPHSEQESVKTLGGLHDLAKILVFFVDAVLLSPMIEEFFFRGFLQTYLKNYTSTWMALILSSGTFAFAHANLAAAIPLWLLGFMLGLAYEHTGCLLLPMGIHGCWNFITALNVLLEKGNN